MATVPRLQEVYATVWRKAAQFDASRASAITWLAMITRNKAIDRIRAAPASARTAPIEWADDVADPAPSLVVPVPAPADAQGRVPELWLIPPGEAPRSLGLVSIDKAHTVSVPADIRRALAVGSTLAISLEPQGGAPQGVPTGPIVAKGGIQAI